METCTPNFRYQPQYFARYYYRPILFESFGGLLSYTTKPAELQIGTVVLICLTFTSKTVEFISAKLSYPLNYGYPIFNVNWIVWFGHQGYALLLCEKLGFTGYPIGVNLRKVRNQKYTRPVGAVRKLHLPSWVLTFSKPQYRDTLKTK